MTKTKRAPARGTAASARQKSTRITAPKHKGGPVPGTPSPMRTRLSADLHDHARRLYETTAQPVSHIALDCGVDESVIRRMAKREGWVRYIAPPRDLPPVAKLLAQVEQLEKGDGDVAEQDATQNIARFTQVVMAHLDEFEAMRRDGRLLPKHHLATARAISILTEAFNRLARLRAALPGTFHDDSATADMPANLDAFREELAQRIETFLASRTDAGAFIDAAAAPAAATE